MLLNDGGASFDVPLTIMDDGLETTSIATADMDGDGSVDVVKLDRGPSAFFNEVTVLPNRCRPSECPADLDRDGRLTLFDFLVFQNAFDAGDPIADFDGDGELTLFDFLAFQNAFDAGCA
ncbi:MAG: GC-type dockerin domain-anchored protein [Planctomycetota bacterium]